MAASVPELIPLIEGTWEVTSLQAGCGISFMGTTMATAVAGTKDKFTVSVQLGGMVLPTTCTLTGADFFMEGSIPETKLTFDCAGIGHGIAGRCPGGAGITAPGQSTGGPQITYLHKPVVGQKGFGTISASGSFAIAGGDVNCPRAMCGPELIRASFVVK